MSTLTAEAKVSISSSPILAALTPSISTLDDTTTTDERKVGAGVGIQVGWGEGAYVGRGGAEVGAGVKAPSPMKIAKTMAVSKPRMKSVSSVPMVQAKACSGIVKGPNRTHTSRGSSSFFTPKSASPEDSRAP